MRPIAGLAGVGAHARDLAQHQRRLLGGSDPLRRREHVQRPPGQQLDRLREPPLAVLEHPLRGVGGVAQEVTAEPRLAEHAAGNQQQHRQRARVALACHAAHLRAGAKRQAEVGGRRELGAGAAGHRHGVAVPRVPAKRDQRLGRAARSPTPPRPACPVPVAAGRPSRPARRERRRPARAASPSRSGRRTASCPSPERACARAAAPARRGGSAGRRPRAGRRSREAPAVCPARPPGSGRAAGQPSPCSISQRMPPSATYAQSGR